MELIGMSSDKLKQLRGPRTQKEVAQAIGIGTNTYCSYENGNRVPRDDIKIRLAEYYGVSVQELFF